MASHSSDGRCCHANVLSRLESTTGLHSQESLSSSRKLHPHPAESPRWWSLLALVSQAQQHSPELDGIILSGAFDADQGAPLWTLHDVAVLTRDGVSNDESKRSVHHFCCSRRLPCIRSAERHELLLRTCGQISALCRQHGGATSRTATRRNHRRGNRWMYIEERCLDPGARKGPEGCQSRLANAEPVSPARLASCAVALLLTVARRARTATALS